MTLWGLFASAFLASTLLPGGSEVVLALVANEHQHAWPVLLAVATLGNTLGGMTSWLIGRVLPAARGDDPRFMRALARIKRYGAPVLLLSWAPVIGDPLCVAAGWLRIGWLRSLALIAAGKAARYAVLLAVVQ